MAIAGVWAESIGSSRPPVFVGGLGIAIIGAIATLLVIARGMHGKLWAMREESKIEQ